jgi:hypothetical protein
MFMQNEYVHYHPCILACPFFCGKGFDTSILDPGIDVLHIIAIISRHAANVLELVNLHFCDVTLILEAPCCKSSSYVPRVPSASLEDCKSFGRRELSKNTSTWDLALRARRCDGSRVTNPPVVWSNMDTGGFAPPRLFGKWRR